MLNNYFTIDNEAEIEIIEKKSRFIGYAKPVSSEEDAIAFVDSIRKAHYDASHNCYAYQIGERNEIQRYSDDGEPAGTAGMPILNVLVGENVKNVILVVTRYFGGTLLGTGGLVRAYGKAAKESLLKAGIVEKILTQNIKVTVDYQLSGKIQYEIMNNDYILEDTFYTDKVVFSVFVKADMIDSFVKNMINATSANVSIEKLDFQYINSKKF